jgi:hypothetical protein
MQLRRIHFAHFGILGEIEPVSVSLRALARADLPHVELRHVVRRTVIGVDPLAVLAVLATRLLWIEGIVRLPIASPQQLAHARMQRLRRIARVEPRVRRMADFALWATACETALWPAGAFWSAYCGNRDEAVEGVIDADPVAAAVRAMMQPRTERTMWTGNATDLLGALGEVVGERVTKSKSWPDSPRSLSGRLRRTATFLRKIGINISFEREGRARTRTIVITTTDDAAPENDGTRPSAPSASSASPAKLNANNRFAATPLRTAADDADGTARGRNSTVRASPLKSNGRNGAGGADANLPPQSAPDNAGWRARL